MQIKLPNFLIYKHLCFLSCTQIADTANNNFTTLYRLLNGRNVEIKNHSLVIPSFLRQFHDNMEQSRPAPMMDTFGGRNQSEAQMRRNMLEGLVY